MDAAIRRTRRRAATVAALAITAAACVGYARIGGSGRSVARAQPVAVDPRAGDPVAELQRLLDAGDTALRYDDAHGYLRSVLAALDVPVESQVLVYSKTSLQSGLIAPDNPRAIYFNDAVAVAWVPGGFIEIAAFDPAQGARFWVLAQTETDAPRFTRDGRCATCHQSNDALGTNGFLLRSIPTSIRGATLPWLGNAVPTHATPTAERWGGWYVTGDPGTDDHLGNLQLLDARAAALPAGRAERLEHLAGQLDTTKYLTPYSDVVALLVLDHQIRMMNLLLRLREEAQAAAAGDEARLDALVADAVDYMLFVGEARLGAVRGSAGFDAAFTARGPRDRHGRSLRDLDLDGRLMRYPLSYMIHSAAFDGLPAAARDAVYARLLAVLSGADADPRYAHLGAADRRTIVEILVDTRTDLPAGFAAPDR